MEWNVVTPEPHPGYWTRYIETHTLDKYIRKATEAFSLYCSVHFSRNKLHRSRPIPFLFSNRVTGYTHLNSTMMFPHYLYIVSKELCGSSVHQSYIHHGPS